MHGSRISQRPKAAESVCQTEGLSGGGCCANYIRVNTSGSGCTVGVKYIIIRRTIIIIIIMIRVRIFMEAAVEVHEFAMRGFLLYYNIVILYKARRFPVTTTVNTHIHTHTL